MTTNERPDAALSLARNSHGVADLRLLRLVRRRDRHEIQDLTVTARLEGAFDAAYTAGVNRDALPADTMRNMVYALAHERLQADTEAFGLELAAHFLDASPPAARVTIEIRERPWRRIVVREKPYGHAFMQPDGEIRVAVATRTRQEAEVTAGLDDLRLLKTANAAFWGFPRDRYTTLRETRDRLLATVLKARWRYGSLDQSFEAAWRGVRQTLLETFADHASQSVQHTLYGMGEAVLQEHANVEEITLTMPDRPHLVVDLSPFGLDNRNEIFLPTDEPLGIVEGTVRR
jgi:urate oxidase